MVYDRVSPPHNTDQAVERNVLAHLARSTQPAVRHGNSSIIFGLLNVRSVTGEGHLVQDLLSDPKLMKQSAQWLFHLVTPLNLSLFTPVDLTTRGGAGVSR